MPERLRTLRHCIFTGGSSPGRGQCKTKIPEAEASGNLLEVTTRFELVDEGFADPCLTTWPRHHIWSEYFHSIWSGRRGSNSLPPPWQGGALPDELRPHIGAFTLAPQGKTTRIGLEPTTPSVTGWCSNQLSYRAIWWKLTGSNR